eukprot:10584766-Alexandrium_andersonii.AAC.1
MGGSEFRPSPSRGQCHLDCQATWDHHLHGWILGPRPSLTRGLSDCASAGAYDTLGHTEPTTIA